MPIWWKVSVARNPATKPNASRVTDVETVSDADRAMAFPPVMRGLLAARVASNHNTRKGRGVHNLRIGRVDRFSRCGGWSQRGSPRQLVTQKNPALVALCS